MPHKAAKVLLLWITCSFYFLCSVAKNCLLHERDALLTFKHGITNDTENTLASWQLHQDCCRWKGITCSNFTGHVVKLDLRDAHLLGQISPSLLSLEYLEYLDLSTNFQGRPIQRVPEFLGHMKNLRYLDLSYGPNGIVSMVGIDLSLNYLTENIGSMKSLEWLDLSRNNLSSEIPPSLSDLTCLSSLDVSYNNLTGPIPSGRQLDTLYSGNPSIYEGNSGLCGPPVGRNCSGRNSDESVNEIRSENDSKLFFYFGLSSGFLVGLWVVFCSAFQENVESFILLPLGPSVRVYGCDLGQSS
ncbi:hypothetical protein PR202_ga22186 [Eleusine coracana subsp. coracana]|uniref:Leucine-rich repeat-containing N-terminal plant-type domain-containing protein n=1 Tax=Eleusine coracana subsp. coracana TaxID=191504 RepID=A0AAV5D1K3_ELECO|nr:hypothetical protein PR202_ga22186 [Eleusine coracana subsp. coracana]